ncbi:MAG: membrane-bound lytic murein transglycosylase MltF [Woeseiaceae bacterium]|nr:membrane-bound lytic murein transglycosylase MltF [Woeseiaceae bacterium]
MRILSIMILAALIGTCSQPPPLLEQVYDLGKLRVVTRNSPVSYYEGPDGPRGPEYDLFSRFADDLGVELEIIDVESVSEIVPTVLNGDAHMAAAGLSITAPREAYLNFGFPYDRVDMHLIYKLGTGKPRSMEDVVGREIEVMAGSSHVEVLSSLKTLYPELEWRENADAEVTELLAAVAIGDLDLTISDSTEFNIQRHFHPDLRVALDLELDDPIAWAFPRDRGDSLLARADDFLIRAKRNGLIARVHDRYYGHTDEFDYVGTRSFIRHYESRLPQYRAMFEEAGDRWGVDWRLLAAIGYQESHWRPSAVSPTGVRGIMMLTQDTAEYLGIDNRVDPRNSIFGGAEFYARQTERVADSVPEPDRTWMALAAYNVGFYHLKDAQQIAEWRGGDRDTWIDVSEALPLLSQRKWYSRVPYGYARGWEPVLYVNNIRSYYNILKWLTANEEADKIDTLPSDEELEDSVETATGDTEDATDTA